MQRFGGRGPFLAIALVVLVVVISPGAVFLWFAIAIYNAICGGKSPPTRVPVPGFEKLAGIISLITAVQMINTFIIRRLAVTVASIAALNGKEIDVLATLVCIPVSLLVMAALLSSQLPATFARAMLVTLCYLFVSVVGLGILVTVVFVSRVALLAV